MIDLQGATIHGGVALGDYTGNIVTVTQNHSGTAKTTVKTTVINNKAEKKAKKLNRIIKLKYKNGETKLMAVVSDEDEIKIIIEDDNDNILTEITL